MVVKVVAHSGSATPADTGLPGRPPVEAGGASEEVMFLSTAEQTPLDLDALAVHLGTHGLALDADIEPRQFRGGLANINYLISIDGRLIVLRRPPSGDLPPGAHDMAREHRILSRLWQAFALAPRSRHLCTDTAVLGVPFQLIEYHPGIIVRGDDLSPVALWHDAPERLTRLMIDTLARIHAVPVGEVGLDDLGRPNGFLARGVSGWIDRSRAVGSERSLRALIDEIGQWLAARIEQQPERAPTLLHCDFKLDNIILSSDTREPVAVIDWDMGTRGDPLFDLATLLSYWTEFGDPDCMHRLAQMPTAQAGFPDRETVAQRYAEATGCDLTGFEVVRVMALFKLGVVFLQLHQRWREGGLGNDRYAGFGSLGEELLQFTRDVATGHRF